MNNNQNDTSFTRARGWRALLALVTLTASSTLWAQSTLKDVSFSAGAGGAVDVMMSLDQFAGEPSVFTTDNPPRIAIDFPNTRNMVDRRTQAIGSGATRSVTVVEAGGRTRVVIDLFRNAGYETRSADGKYTVSISGANALAQTAVQTPVPGTMAAQRGNQVSNVDFRRGANGEGRIIVSFTEPGANVDLNKSGDQIIALITDATLPPELDQRLDVMDFATPVEFINTRRDGNRIRMDLTVRGEYEHLGYQSGNQYVIEIKEFEEPVDTRTAEEIALAPPEYTGNRVTFNFQDIEVRALLQLIADVSGLNVVVSDSVGGSVTLRLQNVPWDQALDIVLQAKALDKRQVGNVIWVAPADEIAAREQAQLAALEEKRQLEPLRSTFVQVNYAKATDLETIIRSASTGEEGTGLLSERGSVTVDERTNVLLLNDTADRLTEIRELVTLLDRPVRQVQIESRIVVASDTFGKELGARFGVTGGYEDSHGNLFTTGGSVAATDQLNNTAFNNRIQNGSSLGPVFFPGAPGGPILGPSLGNRLNFNLPASANAGRFGVSLLTSDYLLDLELSALEQEGRGEIISSPRLITANQKEAFIQQGVEIPFQQASSSGATNVEFKEAVLELRVQPLITPDDRVVLDLAVKNDSVGELFAGENGAQIPAIDTREIGTQVLVDNGQTVVLGGIYQQTIRVDKNKVPVIGDIPGVGRLFRQRTEEDDKSELLIFVTPTILTESLGAY